MWVITTLFIEQTMCSVYCVNHVTGLHQIYLACPAGVEPATYGLEGLANLQNTISNNDPQWVGLTVHQNRGDRGIQWGLESGSWYLQAFVGKTDFTSTLL